MCSEEMTIPVLVNSCSGPEEDTSNFGILSMLFVTQSMTCFQDSRVLLWKASRRRRLEYKLVFDFHK